MFLVQHLQEKCNTLSSIDYVIANFGDELSNDGNITEEVLNDLIMKRFELTIKGGGTIVQLEEFFEGKLK